MCWSRESRSSARRRADFRSRILQQTESYLNQHLPRTTLGPRYLQASQPLTKERAETAARSRLADRLA